MPVTYRDVTDGSSTDITVPDAAQKFLMVEGGELKEATLEVVSDFFKSGQSVLSADFNITGATTVFQDTGLSVTLPEAGTYLLLANVRARCQGNAGTLWAIEAKLYNSTDAADVANSIRRCIYTAATAQLQTTTPISVLVTVAATKTIKLYAARTFDGSFTSSDIASLSTVGLTSLSYVKITG